MTRMDNDARVPRNKEARGQNAVICYRKIVQENLGVGKTAPRLGVLTLLHGEHEELSGSEPDQRQHKKVAVKIQLTVNVVDKCMCESLNL